jgi:SAM-dependent methyltransferase
VIVPGAVEGSPIRPARLREVARRLYYLCVAFGLDPRRVGQSWRALPSYLRNVLAYRRRNRRPVFRVRVRDLEFATVDRFHTAGVTRGHYFLQDLWAARWLHEHGVRRHVDVGSRIDGFVGHVLPFCEVTYVDIRPVDAQVEGLLFRQGSVTALPLEDESVDSLSCLHVIEHIGLGRYGDEVDPEGYLKAAAELTRVLKPGGHLLLATPVGGERLCFDAHRVFDPETVVAAFHGLALRTFGLIDDAGGAIRFDAGWRDARRCIYGCGLFVFEKA